MSGSRMSSLDAEFRDLREEGSLLYTAMREL